MRIEHIALWVQDLEQSRAFYELYFDGEAGSKYENIQNGFSSYFLSFEDGCRLEIMNMPNIGAKVGQRGYDHGLAHFTFSVGDEDQVKTLTEKLRSAGYTIFSEPRWTGDGYFESVVLDPEGNYVEITI